MSYYQEAKQHFIACHQHPINQALHHLVNVIAIVGIIYIPFNWVVSLICLILTQVFAIGGHIVFEKNKPAFVKYPGIVILASMAWSFENWFGLKPLIKSKSMEDTDV